MKPSSILIFLVSGCSPESESPDSASTTETGDLPYVVQTEEDTPPDFDEDSLVQAIEGALAELLSVDAAPILEAYDSLLSHAETGCPDWLNSEGYTYWVDDCTTEDGTLFDGFGTLVELEGFEDTDGTIWNQRAIYMLGELADAEGNGLVGAGSASDSTAVNLAGADISMTNIGEGFGLSGDMAAGTWLEERSSPQLYRYTINLEKTGAFALYLDALTELESDELDLLAVDELLLYNAAMGSDCPLEPAGSLSLRLSSGDWLDLSFDGPLWGEVTDPGLCDGCGSIWAKEVSLGQLCLDFSALLPAESDPEGGE